MLSIDNITRVPEYTAMIPADAPHYVYAAIHDDDIVFIGYPQGVPTQTNAQRAETRKHFLDIVGDNLLITPNTLIPVTTNLDYNELCHALRPLWANSIDPERYRDIQHEVESAAREGATCFKTDVFPSLIMSKESRKEQ